ncbi:MAG: hypothetical protein AAF492_12245, partial [Verrucomicrobiota bacterium]
MNRPYKLTEIVGTLTLGVWLAGGLPLFAQAPMVDHGGGASSPGPASITLNGTLSGGAADVFIYWGDADGGANPAAWDNRIDFGNRALGPFSTNLVGLLYGLQYHYRAFASNAMGTAWAPASSAFLVDPPAGAQPNGIGGLELWLNAGTIGSNNNETVGFWPDDSGHGYHVDRLSGGASDPAYLDNVLNGHPVVRYDGNDYHFTTHNFSGLGPYSIFSVARYTDPGHGVSSDRVICSRDNNWLFGFYVESTEEWYAGGWIHQGGNANTDWHVHIGTHNDDPDPAAAFWMDGVLLTTNNTASTTLADVPGRIALGARNNSTDKSSRCEIAEIIIYNRVLSDAELLTVAGYLSEKYNLPTALPVSPFVELQITSDPISNLTGDSAQLNATVGGNGAVFDVTAYYGTADGGVNPGLWDNSLDMGSFTNRELTAIGAGLSGLAGTTTYYYRYRLQNAATTIWTTATGSFTTPLDLTDFNAQLKITFDGYTRPQTLNDFPTLVTLGTNLQNFTYESFCSTNGGDLRFFNSNLTEELSYEVERWDPDGESLLWVPGPQQGDARRIRP